MLCILLRPMGISSNNNTAASQPSNDYTSASQSSYDLDERQARGNFIMLEHCLEMNFINLSHFDLKRQYILLNYHYHHSVHTTSCAFMER